MSKADKIFKKLGYKKEHDIAGDIIYTRKTRQWREEGIIVIDFCSCDEEISIIYEGEVSRNLPAFISVKELQAINKKCEELGWI